MLITRPQKQVWTLSAMTAGGGVNLRGSVTWRLCNGREMERGSALTRIENALIVPTRTLEIVLCCAVCH
jgi:hypothetical protein